MNKTRDYLVSRDYVNLILIIAIYLFLLLFIIKEPYQTKRKMAQPELYNR